MIGFIKSLVLFALRLLWGLLRLIFPKKKRNRETPSRKLSAMITGKNSPYVFSHWYHLVQNLSESSQRFYHSLEQAIYRRNIPNLRLSRVIRFESGVFSARREYLRAIREDYRFEICAAPFGNGFFISWWLLLKPTIFWRLAIRIPLLGNVLFAVLRPATYYDLDAALMFRESVHSAVLEVLDSTTNARGLRSLSDHERKPILTELFSP